SVWTKDTAYYFFHTVSGPHAAYRHRARRPCRLATLCQPRRGRASSRRHPGNRRGASALSTPPAVQGIPQRPSGLAPVAAPRVGVTRVSVEAHLPYHRPPLSKGYLKDPHAEPQLLRPESAYEGMTLHLRTRAEHIDAEARKVTLSDGRVLPYDALVLASGTRPRRLPGLPAALDNLHYLRTIDDALRLRVSLAEAKSVTVLG